MNLDRKFLGLQSRDDPSGLLTIYAAELIELERRIRELDAERNTYRELLQIALARLHRLTHIVYAQRRCLNDRTREYATSVFEETREIDEWLNEPETERPAA